MTLLIVLGSVLGYVVVGAAYARGQSVATYRRILATWQREWPLLARGADTDSMFLMELRGALWLRFFLWPIMACYDRIRWDMGGLGLFSGPIHAAREKADDLRAEAARYDELIRSCDDPTDRDLMRRGQQALRQQADALTLRGAR